MGLIKVKGTVLRNKKNHGKQFGKILNFQEENLVRHEASLDYARLRLVLKNVIFSWNYTYSFERACRSHFPDMREIESKF